VIHKQKYRKMSSQWQLQLAVFYCITLQRVSAFNKITYWTQLYAHIFVPVFIKKWWWNGFNPLKNKQKSGSTFLYNISRLPEKQWFFGRSPFFFTGNSNTQMKMNGASGGRRKTRTTRRKILCHCHFLHHKSQVDYPRNEPGPRWWEAWVITTLEGKN
jgi:hypothetical protein